MKPLRRLIEHDTINVQTGAGTISALARYTLVVSTGSDALVLPDGTYDGQTVTITHVTDGGSAALSSATTNLAYSVASVTLTNAREWAKLVWRPSLGAWVVVESSPVGVVA